MENLKAQGVTHARIAAVATHLPKYVLGNDELAVLYPDWSADKIFDKTGIRERRIAAADETALDLGCHATANLLRDADIAPERIDFVILCTQAPDYFLPSSACLLQHRMGLRRQIGALDINLGCSGFVYGLSLATGLIASGAARSVLLVTADTYSKYINAGDKSVRTLFGDGAAATLIEASEGGEAIGPFVFGTDGSGAESLIVEAGGFRMPTSSATGTLRSDSSGNVRSKNDLYMDGPAVMNFSLREVPATVKDLLNRTNSVLSDIDYFILHQANKFMLDSLQRKLKICPAAMPRFYETVGNTVSSTIPFVLSELLRSSSGLVGKRAMLVGFGVGLSWAGAMVQF